MLSCGHDKEIDNMKKKLRLKWWVKGLIELVIVIIAICSLVNVVNAKKAQDAENEKQLVENYVQCLKDNFTQRDYCSRPKIREIWLFI